MSVEFDPVRLRPRRRRIDLVTVGVFGAVIALAVAVAKPWEPVGAPASPRPSLSAVARPVMPNASPSPAAIGPTVATAAPTLIWPPPTWDDVRPTIEAHDTWGVRAIVVGTRPEGGSGASPGYIERWSRTRPSGSGVDTAYLDPDDQSIVGLGITFPPSRAPLDARISRLHTDVGFEWVDARPLDGGEPDGAFLFFRFGTSGAGSESWAAGRYRIDVVTREGVHRIELQIPGRFGNVPPPDA